MKTVCTKTPYADKRAAVTAMNASLRRKRNRPKYLRMYRCECCNAWHLTHQEEAES